MRFLNVNNTLDPVSGGGSAERTLQVSRCLGKRGVDCTVLSLDTGVTDAVRERAGRAHVVVLPCSVERYFIPSVSWNTLSGLVRSADIIQMTNHWTLLNAMVFHYAVRYEKPYISCPAGSIPVFGRSRVLKNIYDAMVGRRIFKHTRACVAISPKEIPGIRGYGVPDAKISVIPNGIDPGQYTDKDDEAFRVRHRLPDSPLILFMGRLNPIKGPDLLLDAFIETANSRDIPHHLVFAGPDGGMLDELRAISRRNGFARRVHFLGYITDRDKSEACHAADFMVIPSRQEAMSIVVLEAGISGTPVLITDMCGFDSVESVNGGMVVPASIEGLRRGIDAMLDDRTKLAEMGQNLLKFVRENYLWEHTASLYLELFDKVLVGRSL